SLLRRIEHVEQLLVRVNRENGAAEGETLVRLGDQGDCRFLNHCFAAISEAPYGLQTENTRHPTREKRSLRAHCNFRLQRPILIPAPPEPLEGSPERRVSVVPRVEIERASIAVLRHRRCSTRRRQNQTLPHQILDGVTSGFPIGASWVRNFHFMRN